ncbi:MAG TPA: cytidine deaminase [Thermoanaerobaculia bacterium]|jgi:cytidine deaminase|nr:cytidine deaminase [Thermoanaerobaculia bacterium]
MIDLMSLLPQAAAFAKPPISNFEVGAIAQGRSGKLYFGANVEFAGEALSFTVHAEQSAVVNAWMGGETGIDVVATSAAPCGYCRQFLNELVTASELVIVMPGDERKLSDLLPHSFGPRDLGVTGGLLAPAANALAIDEDDELARAALVAANMSYAPYSKAYAGVALRTNGGKIVSAPYAENAAFNPSLSPLEAALSQLNMTGGVWSDIAEVALVQAEAMHTSATRTVLGAISSAPLRVIQARNSR